MAEEKTVISLVCERAVDLQGLCNSNDEMKDVPGVKVIKFPCSGMIQPLMIEAALKGGAGGVIVCGCQIGDCYYREGNKHIRERLLGERTPTLKKNTDRRRIVSLWLSRVQKQRFVSEAKEFVAKMKELDSAPAAAPASAAASPPANPPANPPASPPASPA